MKKNKVKIIRAEDLIRNSSDKLGRHMAEVRTGTGVHKSKKQYDRKSKSSQRLKKELKSYQKLAADLFFCRKLNFKKSLDVSIKCIIQYPLVGGVPVK